MGVRTQPGAQERLLEVVAELGVSQAELSRRSGLAPAHISDMVRGTRPIGDKLSVALSREWAVSTSWLLYGLGPKYLPGVLPGRPVVSLEADPTTEEVPPLVVLPLPPGAPAQLSPSGIDEDEIIAGVIEGADRLGHWASCRWAGRGLVQLLERVVAAGGKSSVQAYLSQVEAMQLRTNRVPPKPIRP